jgi:hypothetical protein
VYSLPPTTCGVLEAHGHGQLGAQLQKFEDWSKKQEDKRKKDIMKQREQECVPLFISPHCRKDSRGP